jgi:hypothetical protein
MPSFMDMMTMRAIENIGALLIDPDPYVRLQASFAVLEFTTPRIEEMDDEMDEDAPEDGADRDDLAELNEFPGQYDPSTGPLAEEEAAGEARMQTPEEIAERLAAAAQVQQEERTPPAAERAGRSAIGSGQQR